MGSNGCSWYKIIWVRTRSRKNEEKIKSSSHERISEKPNQKLKANWIRKAIRQQKKRLRINGKENVGWIEKRTNSWLVVENVNEM